MESAHRSWKPVAAGLLVVAGLTLGIPAISERLRPDTRYRLEIQLPDDRFTGLVEITEGSPSDPVASTEPRSAISLDARGKAKIANLAAVLTLGDDSRREIECFFPDGRRLRRDQPGGDGEVRIRDWPAPEPGRMFNRLTFYVGDRPSYRAALDQRRPKSSPLRHPSILRHAAP